jgi:phosphocarrier protein FPr
MAAGPGLPTFEWQAEPGGTVVRGVPASPGIAIGPLRHYRRGRFVVEQGAFGGAKSAEGSAAEKARLKEALAAARAQLDQLYREMKERTDAAQASIFLAHAQFLDDPELVQAVEGRIEAGDGAASAWKQTVDERVAALKQVDNPLIAGRAVDLRDVGDQVLSFLARRIGEGPTMPGEAAILLADDLTPSDTARLDPALILGFCTAGGGPNSHSAIIARALGIPAIAGAGPTLLDLP